MKKNDSQKIIIEQLSQDLEDLVNYLKDLWQFLPIPILYVNPLFVILDANPALENFFGVRAIEIIGEKIEVLLGEKPITQEILETLSKEKKIENKEIEVFTRNGKKIVSVSANSREDEKGKIIGYYFLFLDITTQQELREKLEEKVRERTKELQEKIDELEAFQKLTVGRELKMIELKEEIERLKKELERSKKEK